MEHSASICHKGWFNKLVLLIILNNACTAHRLQLSPPTNLGFILHVNIMSTDLWRKELGKSQALTCASWKCDVFVDQRQTCSIAKQLSSDFIFDNKQSIENHYGKAFIIRKNRWPHLILLCAWNSGITESRWMSIQNVNYACKIVGLVADEKCLSLNTEHFFHAFWRFCLTNDS